MWPLQRISSLCALAKASRFDNVNNLPPQPTGCTVALKMVSEVLSGKEAAADVRSNLKKVVDKLKVKM